MERSLINPNQIWMNGLEANGISMKEVFEIMAKSLCVLFETNGLSAYWESKVSTFEEIDNLDLPHL